MADPRPTHLTELMDDPAVDPGKLAQSLRFIRRVNRYLGGTRAVMGHLRQWSSRWPKGHQVTFADVGTGSADIPLAVARWAARAGFEAKIIAVDLHATTLSVARAQIAGSGGAIALLRADAMALPLADGSIDYALCSMFLHHLTEADALRVVREMLRVARRGIVVNDLLRTNFARVGIRALTLFAGEIDKHDARVSVEKAWAPAEIGRWPGELGANFLKFRVHPFARFTLAGERSGPA